MEQDPEVEQVVTALRVAVGLLVRRLRQIKGQGDLTGPEISALAHLERGGPTSASALAKIEQISPQSMGTILDALEARGFIARGPDPGDGRRAIVSATPAGRQAFLGGRSARTDLLVRALSREFSSAERRTLLAAAPLIERLAQVL